MKILSILFAVAFFGATMPVNLLAEDKPKKNWKDSAEFSYVSTNGNSKATTISGKNVFTYNWVKTALEIAAGGLGTKSEGSTTAEQYFASQKLSRKLSEKNYIFEKYRWDKDRFAGIDARHDIQAGLGRELLNTAKHKINAELGGGYVSEERIGEPRNDFGSGRAYGKYLFLISETAEFSQDGEYLHNFEDEEDFRVNAETALKTKISTYLSLKVSYTVKYVAQPPRGFGKTDTTTAIALIFDY